MVDWPPDMHSTWIVLFLAACLTGIQSRTVPTVGVYEGEIDNIRDDSSDEDDIIITPNQPLTLVEKDDGSKYGEGTLKEVAKDEEPTVKDVNEGTKPTFVKIDNSNEDNKEVTIKPPSLEVDEGNVNNESSSKSVSSEINDDSKDNDLAVKASHEVDEDSQQSDEGVSVEPNDDEEDNQQVIKTASQGMSDDGEKSIELALSKEGDDTKGNDQVLSTVSQDVADDNKGSAQVTKPTSVERQSTENESESIAEKPPLQEVDNDDKNTESPKPPSQNDDYNSKNRQPPAKPIFEDDPRVYGMNIGLHYILADINRKLTMGGRVHLESLIKVLVLTHKIEKSGGTLNESNKIALENAVRLYPKVLRDAIGSSYSHSLMFRLDNIPIM